MKQRFQYVRARLRIVGVTPQALTLTSNRPVGHTRTRLHSATAMIVDRRPLFSRR